MDILLHIEGGDSWLKNENVLFFGSKIQNLEPSSIAWGMFNNIAMPATY